MLSRLLPLAAAALFCTASAFAQTWAPRTISLEGADQMDQAEVMRVMDLKPNTPLSKEQIEAAMQRMADSGLFSDLSYKVDTNALIFVVKPAASSQSLPVRYSNFVWWQPGELEPLVEARVPLFHGRLPLTGKLTTEVQSALAGLLAEKGIAGAQISAMQSRIAASSISLLITQPRVILGNVDLAGTAPEASRQMHIVLAHLAEADFDLTETPETIRANTLDTHRNAGFLDVSIDPVRFAPPRKDMLAYAVDATSTVHPGGLYRVSAITFEGVDPKLWEGLSKTAAISPGDPASEMNLRIAEGLLVRSFEDQGMLDAEAPAQVTKDASAHTAAYRFLLKPGPVYAFTGCDVSGLPPDAQSRFQSAFKTKSGTPVGIAVRSDIAHALHAAGLGPNNVTLTLKRDRSAHTASYVLAQKSSH